MDKNDSTDGAESRDFGEVADRDTSIDADESEDINDEGVEDRSEDSQGAPDETDNQEDLGDAEGQSEEGDSQEPTLTEKGTKLDPNPRSAIHQQLANEKRIRGQMEQVLSSPELIAQFVKNQYGIDMQTTKQNAEGGQEVAPTGKKWTAKDFESLEDVADKFNQLSDNFRSEISKRDDEIKKLNGQLTGISQKSAALQVADRLEGDVNSLRSMPELNPKSPDFVEGLEDEIGALYHKLDFDENAQMYRGNYSLRELGESIIRTARAAKKAGSKRAQTIVKDKASGKVRTSAGKSSAKPDRDSLSPAESIAQGIRELGIGR